MTTIIKVDTPQDALKSIRKLRLANKNKWIFLTIHLGEKTFHAKTFNLFIQRLQCDDISHPDGSDLSAKQFDEKFLTAFTY